MKQRISGKLFYSLILTIFVQILFLKNAFAYLDPGTGSYIFQVMVATIIGGLYAIKTYWQKIKIFFNHHFFRKHGNGK